MAYSHNALRSCRCSRFLLAPVRTHKACMDRRRHNQCSRTQGRGRQVITELVAKQKAAGLHVITTGEFRRGWWHFETSWGFNGVDHAAAAPCRLP